MGIATGVLAEQLLLEQLGTVLAHVKGRAGTGVVYDAVASDAFCHQLLSWIVNRGGAPSRTSRIAGVRTAAYEAYREEGDLTGPISRGSVEQSHTTIVFARKYMLKLFRRLDIGVNPDFEVGRFLTEKTGFIHVPKTLGALEISRPRYEPTSLALLQSLVRNQGQGWEYILGVLDRFYEQVESEQHRLERIETPSIPVFDLAGTEPPQDVFEVVGAALHSAGVLGTRTGEMHLALSSDPSDPAFAPEPLTTEELSATVSRLRDQSHQSFKLLRSKLDSLGERDRLLADRVLAEGPAIVARLGRFSEGQENLIKIRIHGDYHLGQVLWAENDFVILDFEGEPGRSMADRRAKKSPLRDVAGMLRSFDYAVSRSMLIYRNDHQNSLEHLEPWAQIWRIWTSATFLEGYRRTVAPVGLLPADPAATRQLLDLYTLEKTLFELQYELNYRPDWISIPMMGILRLVNRS
jgi:maltose alpha-D-glucosyltransferase/alpha-amylase